jgi:hypothetical protein
VVCPEGSEWDGAACVSTSLATPKASDDGGPSRIAMATAATNGAAGDSPRSFVDEPASVDVRDVVAPANEKPPLWLAAAAPGGGTLAGGLLFGLTSGFAIADIENRNSDDEGFEPLKLSVGDVVFAGASYDERDRRNKGGYVIVHSLVAVGGAAGGALGSWAAGGDAVDAAVIGGVTLAMGLVTALPTASVYDSADLPPTVTASTVSGLAIIAASAITGAALHSFRE